MRLILAALLLSGCATAPEELASIHSATMERITYQHYVKRDWRYIHPDAEGSGNCAVFAFTNLLDTKKAGYDSELVVCRLADGTGHSYVNAGGWALDNRHPYVFPVNQQDCK